MKRIFLIICILFSFVIVNAKEINMTVEDIKVSDKSDTISVVEPSFNNNEVSSNITFNELNDYVVLDITIKNNDEDKYLIKTIEDNNKNENIDIEYSFSDDYINSLETSIIKMTIKYNKQLKNIESLKLDDLNISIVFDDGKATINPKTSDNLVLYIIISIISLIGIILAFKYLKKSKKVLALLIVLLPIIVLGKEVFKLHLVFKDIDIIGVFDIFNVQIKPNNNDSNETLEIRYGDPIGNLTVPDKEGYTFIGWVDASGNTVDEDTIVTSDLIINAKYNPNDYNISYEPNGGSNDNVNTYTIEDEVVFKDSVKNGYDFLGWFDNEECNGEKITKINIGSIGDKKFYAGWKIIDYSLTYELNGGNATNPDTYTVNDEIVLNTPSKEGYDFKGWYDNSEFNGNAISKINVGTTGNKKLYAKFETIKYTITYNVNGGSNDNVNTYTIEDEVVFNNPEKNGYKFLGWYDNSEFNGDVISKIDVGTTGDKELYAKYEPIEYTITYELNGGSFNNSPIATYTIETNSFALLIPNKEENNFVGWYDNSEFNGNPVSYISKGSTGNKELYAKYEPLQDRAGQTLPDVLTDGAVLDSVKSLFVANNDGIDFSNPSSITNGKGKYILDGTENDEYPIIYYRGEVTDNNVLFADNCWLILRTTDTGGVKLVYNGKPDKNGCNATGVDTFTSSKIKYNSSYNRTESTGYTFTGAHTQTGKNLSTLVVGTVLGNDIKYEKGAYTLLDTYTVDDDFQNDVDGYTKNHHYTCLTSSDTCEKVLYIFMGRDANYYYITLSNGETAEKIINNEYFDTSVAKDSTIKSNVESWFANNLKDWDSYLEDTVYCNDRSAYTKGGWDKDTSIYKKISYGPTARISETYSPSVACKNENDRYTSDTKYGNGMLKYPIGLITADEAALSGFAWFKNSNCYLNNGHLWWTMSPSVLSANFAYVDVLYSMIDNVQTAYTTSSSTLTAGGVRPVISISKDVKIESGTGSKSNPLFIK